MFILYVTKSESFLSSIFGFKVTFFPRRLFSLSYVYNFYVVNFPRYIFSAKAYPISNYGVNRVKNGLQGLYVGPLIFRKQKKILLDISVEWLNIPGKNGR